MIARIPRRGLADIGMRMPCRYDELQQAALFEATLELFWRMCCRSNTDISEARWLMVGNDVERPMVTQNWRIDVRIERAFHTNVC